MKEPRKQKVKVLDFGKQYGLHLFLIHYFYCFPERRRNGILMKLTLKLLVWESSVQFSRSVMSNSLWPHESQHSRPPCPSPPPRVYPNSCPSSRWCHPAISSSVAPLLLLPLISPSIRVFSNESTLHMRWPKYWTFSFSISPSNEYSGLTSFRMDWLNFLAVKGNHKKMKRQSTAWEKNTANDATNKGLIFK